MTAAERLAARLPGVEEAVRSGLLADAQCAICAYTRRSQVPETLLGAQAELAVFYYNRMGAEGETTHSEGGVSRGLEAVPEWIVRQIRPYRLAVIGAGRG